MSDGGAPAGYDGVDDETWARHEAERRRAVAAKLDAELAQMKAESEALAALGDTVARGRGSGDSVVYSIRLTHSEASALRARAAAMGIGVTVLARNLVRQGLVAGNRSADPAFADALGGIEQALVALRALA